MFHFFTRQLNQDEIKELKSIQESFKKIGIQIDINDTNNASLTFNTYDVAKKLKRNAGRIPKFIKNGKKSLLIGDVLDMRETMTDKEIISKLNMSHATFYRRLKQAEQFIDDLGLDDARTWFF